MGKKKYGFIQKKREQSIRKKSATKKKLTHVPSGKPLLTPSEKKLPTALRNHIATKRAKAKGNI